ncbi:glycerol-3-phosphate responsive antiterminator GlpP [Paenibacillus darwinianus]|uniref:Glycerol uptake operon antiterminator regulatory protein n=1 Tax=Paenibacillus darwinianus TaxID=1380763 RepID=A0A9W5RZZ6_9BACL|nr:glycerol-3-phosphate responsive antiterminator [Paenibacillus darwinianus]EXX86581.1 glycerol-3-phosphate responsive antiterminator GlpP [Paenibacillus darwinianus]
MHFNGQRILPAIKKLKDFEKLLQSEMVYMVLLDVHIAQLESIMRYARKMKKRVILHADLIQGLRSDEYAAEFLCQSFKPDAIISTRSEMLKTAKKNRVLAIQRTFLLDTLAIETSYKLADKVQPDYIEVLPGIIPGFIRKFHQEICIPVIAGGLIHTKAEVDAALDAGAVAITSSRELLWTSRYAQ